LDKQKTFPKLILITLYLIFVRKKAIVAMDTISHTSLLNTDIWHLM